jgi:hypothetical protein
VDNNAKYTAKDFLLTVLDKCLNIQRIDHVNLTDKRTKIITVFELEMRHGKAKKCAKKLSYMSK